MVKQKNQLNGKMWLNQKKSVKQKNWFNRKSVKQKICKMEKLDKQKNG